MLPPGSLEEDPHRHRHSHRRDRQEREKGSKRGNPGTRFTLSSRHSLLVKNCLPAHLIQFLHPLSFLADKRLHDIRDRRSPLSTPGQLPFRSCRRRFYPTRQLSTLPLKQGNKTQAQVLRWPGTVNKSLKSRKMLIQRLEVTPQRSLQRLSFPGFPSLPQGPGDLRKASCQNHPGVLDFIKQLLYGRDSCLQHPQRKNREHHCEDQSPKRNHRARVTVQRVLARQQSLPNQGSHASGQPISGLLTFCSTGKLHRYRRSLRSSPSWSILPSR